MGKVFHSSDWHIGHERILELCGRPFDSVQEMNSTIIERCNDTVTEDDTLVLHGDNVMGKYVDNLPLLRKLRVGTLILLPGNHDRYSLAYARNDDKRRQATEFIYQTLSNINVRIFSDRKPSAWPAMIGEEKVLLSHYPYAGDSQDKDRHADMRPLDEGLPLVHGHVHEKWRENGRMLNVGVDVWDFAPVSEDAIITWLSTLLAKVPT